MYNFQLTRIIFTNVFLIPILILAFSCTNDEEFKNIQEYTGPLMEVDSSVTIYSDSAIVRVKVISPKHLEFKNGDQEYPEGFYIEFYELDGSISSTIKANMGFYTKEKDMYTGIGDVIVKNFEKDQQLNTEELYWKSGEQEIFTDKFVRIETEGDILTGEGLTAKQDFSSYKILKPIGTRSMDDELY